MSMMSEFRSFAMRGNVMDMAVGIIIGGAFGKIISSFVNDVLMPPIGVMLGGVEFSSLSATLVEASGDVAAVTLNYGSFIQAVVDFLIIAFVVFMLVRFVNNAKAAAEKPVEAAPEAPAGPSETDLLIEIRDALKKK